MHRYEEIPDPESDLSLPVVTITDFATGEAGKEVLAPLPHSILPVLAASAPGCCVKRKLRKECILYALHPAAVRRTW